MNFEERKAEIFRRSEEISARRKRKKRIIMGTLVPAMLVAVLAFPTSRILGKDGEKGNFQLSGKEGGSSTIDDSPAATIPTDEMPNVTAYPELNSPAKDLETIPGCPPAITLTTAEGDIKFPGLVRFLLPDPENGEAENNRLQDIAFLLRPGAVKTELTTQSQTLVLDMAELAPEKITVECWPVSDIAADLGIDLPLSQAVYIAKQSADNADRSLYEIRLLPGSYIYRLSLEWSWGYVSYAFIATVE